MDPREVENILEIAGIVGTALHQHVITLDNMLLSIHQQIDSMQGIIRRLKETRTVVLYHCDEHNLDAEEFILTMGNALLPLAKSAYKLEANSDSLRESLRNMQGAVTTSNRFANKLPAIPKRK